MSTEYWLGTAGSFTTGDQLEDPVELENIDGITLAAEDGTLGTAGWPVVDQAGSSDFRAWRPVWIKETAAARERIFNGWIWSKNGGRWEPGSGRLVWDMEVADLNAAFRFRSIRGSDGKRPAETDLERVAWLVGSGYLPLADNGLVNLTDNPINLGEADYRHKYPEDVLRDTAPVSGKRFFAYWDHTAEEPSLFYDQAAAAVGDSTFKISNDPADHPDTNVFPPSDDAPIEFRVSGEDQYDGIDYGYKGTYIYRQRAATFAATDLHRDLVYETDRVGRLETAETLAAAALVNHSAEITELTITVTNIPDEQVNDALEGERIEVKLTHLPGLAAFTWWRITRRVVSKIAPTLYEVRYSLSNSIQRVVPGGGGVTDPYQGSCDESFAQVVQSKSGQPSGVPATFALDDPPTPGNTLIVYGTNRGEPTGPEAPIGFTDAGSGIVNPAEESGAIYYRHVQVGDTVDIDWDGSDIAPDLLYVEERVGQLTFSATEFVSANPLVFGPGDFDGSPITPTSGRRGIVVGYLVLKRDEALVTAGSGWTLRENALVDSVVQHAVVELAVASTSGSYEPQFNTSTSHIAYDDLSYGAISIAFTCEGQPPSPGQEVPEQPTPTQPDGATATFPTTFPFATGSLEVWDDGINETTNIASVDAATGEFTLNYTPEAGSVLTHRFWGR